LLQQVSLSTVNPRYSSSGSTCLNENIVLFPQPIPTDPRNNPQTTLLFGSKLDERKREYRKQAEEERKDKFRKNTEAVRMSLQARNLLGVGAIPILLTDGSSSPVSDFLEDLYEHGYKNLPQLTQGLPLAEGQLDALKKAFDNLEKVDILIARDGFYGIYTKGEQALKTVYPDLNSLENGKVYTQYIEHRIQHGL
jgi:hypothetical protein